MIYAELDIFSPFFFLLDEARCQASAPGVNHRTTLFSLHGRVETEVLPTGKTECAEFLLVAQFFCAVFHQRLQLRQRFLNLRHCSGAVNELSVLWVVLLVGDDQRQKRNGLSGS